jgi:tyrosinase
MKSKTISACISIVAGGVSSVLALTVTEPARAFTFTESYVTPADVLDFTALGYTYDYGYNIDFDTLPSSAAATTGLTVRKNAADMTTEEISDFINALTTLKNTFVITDNGIQISVYDQFVAVHVAMADARGRQAPNGTTLADPAHGGSAFLPWHREMLYQFEKALQTVDPDVFIPYWDWTDTDATVNKIFQDNFMGPDGTGGNRGTEVMTGHFSVANGWTVRRDLGRRWSGLDPTPQALTRDFDSVNTLGTIAQINTVLSQTTYANFRARVQTGGGTHNAMHGWIGGTMANVGASPNDPMFWLLHANVDRLWAEWQVNGHWGSSYYPATGQPYGHNLNDPMFVWDGGALQISADLQDLFPAYPGESPQQVLNGNTLVSGDFSNTGVVSPGNSPGSVTIEGDYVQDALGELTIEIAGLLPGTEYDVLNVGGTAFLDGVLNLYFLGDFAPEAGDTFKFLNASKIVGDFSKIYISGLDTAFDFDWEIIDGAYWLTAIGPSTSSTNGFAQTPGDLANDPNGELYNPLFGETAEYYCYGGTMDHSMMGHGTSTSTEYLPIGTDEIALCDSIAQNDTGSDHVGHGDHVTGDCDEVAKQHSCPLGTNCMGCTGHCSHRDGAESVPEPAAGAALLALGAIAVGSKLKSKQS